MLNGHKIIAIISGLDEPARIPRFATRRLAGHAPFAWTYFAALASGYIDDIVYLSTDQASLNAAKAYGLKATAVPDSQLHQSPSALSGDVQALLPTIAQSFDYFIRLSPAAPLILSSDINRALEAFAATQATYSTSVCELPARMYYAFELASKPASKPDETRPADRQELPPKYYKNGAMVISRSPECILRDTFVADAGLSYVMPAERSVYIEAETDFLLCDILLRSRSAVIPFTRQRQPLGS